MAQVELPVLLENEHESWQLATTTHHTTSTNKYRELLCAPQSANELARPSKHPNTIFGATNFRVELTSQIRFSLYHQYSSLRSQHREADQQQLSSTSGDYSSLFNVLSSPAKSRTP